MNAAKKKHWIGLCIGLAMLMNSCALLWAVYNFDLADAWNGLAALLLVLGVTITMTRLVFGSTIPPKPGRQQNDGTSVTPVGVGYESGAGGGDGGC